MLNTFRTFRASASAFRPLWALWAICIGLCDGYTTFYGPSGQLAGSANTISGYSTYYGPSGQFVGSSNSIGGQTNFYNSDGGLAGSANSVGTVGGYDE